MIPNVMITEPHGYAWSVYHDRHRACGVDLLPMTLGHALLLQRLGSPFASARPGFGGDPAKISGADMLLACLVCSRSAARAARIVNSHRGSAWLKWKWLSRRFRMEADMQAFLRWYRAQWALPDFVATRQTSQGAPRGAEYLHQLVVFCCSHLGYSHAAAFEVPVVLAQYDYLCHLEGDGQIRIVESRDAELEAAAQAALAAAPASHATAKD